MQRQPRRFVFGRVHADGIRRVRRERSVRGETHPGIAVQGASKLLEIRIFPSIIIIFFFFPYEYGREIKFSARTLAYFQFKQRPKILNFNIEPYAYDSASNASVQNVLFSRFRTRF